jgi:hypothetical protein
MGGLLLLRPFAFSGVEKFGEFLAKPADIRLKRE